MSLESIFGGLQLLVIGSGGLVALMTYDRDTRLRRAEWIYRLYAQFYESERFKPVRRLLDYEPEDDIAALQKDMAELRDSLLHEALVDYLNFFEFIAIQIKEKNVKRSEVFDMFDYYIRRLKDHDFIVEYLRNEGFEYLDALLKPLHGVKSAKR